MSLLLLLYTKLVLYSHRWRFYFLLNYLRTKLPVIICTSNVVLLIKEIPVSTRIWSLMSPVYTLLVIILPSKSQHCVCLLNIELELISFLLLWYHCLFKSVCCFLWARGGVRSLPRGKICTHQTIYLSPIEFPIHFICTPINCVSPIE